MSKTNTITSGMKRLSSCMQDFDNILNTYGVDQFISDMDNWYVIPKPQRFLLLDIMGEHGGEGFLACLYTRAEHLSDRRLEQS